MSGQHNCERENGPGRTLRGHWKQNAFTHVLRDHYQDHVMIGLPQRSRNVLSRWYATRCHPDAPLHHEPVAEAEAG